MFFQQTKSITVKNVDGNIYVFDDERFTGGTNNCLDCGYYPCKVNIWYGKKKKIQDCDLWNKVEPSGEIIDRR
jgi:hypothetical protein